MAHAPLSYDDRLLLRRAGRVAQNMAGTPRNAARMSRRVGEHMLLILVPTLCVGTH